MNGCRIRRAAACLLLTACFTSLTHEAFGVPSRSERAAASVRQTANRTKEKEKDKKKGENASSESRSSKPQNPQKPQKPQKPATPLSSEEKAKLEGLPTWSEDEEKKMLTGKIWDDMPEVLPSNSGLANGGDGANEKEGVEPSGSAIPSITEEKSAVESIPEDFTKVLPHYLPAYIRPMEAGLIDPQKLLGEIERNDILMMIAKIREDTGGQIYVSLFAPGQEVPPEINAPALARQIFKPGETSLLLYIHYGDVKGTQIVCDANMTAKLGDNGRRLLLSRVKEHSSLYTNPQDCLIESIIALDELASPELRKLFLEEKERMTPHAVGVPSVNIEFTEKEEVREKHLSEKIKELFAEHQGYAHAVMYGVIILLILAGFYLWSRNCKPVRLLQTVPDKRLSAPNGASISRPVNYGSREDSSPNSISRKQMRDHLRDNS